MCESECSGGCFFEGYAGEQPEAGYPCEYYDIDPRSVADFDDAGNYVLKDVATIKSVMGEHLQYLTGAVTYNNKVRVKVAPNERVAVYTDDERKHLIDLTYWENNGRYMGKLGLVMCLQSGITVQAYCSVFLIMQLRAGCADVTVLPAVLDANTPATVMRRLFR